MKIATCARAGVIAVLATLALASTGWAGVVPFEVGPLDFCTAAEYEDNFGEVRRGTAISPGACAVDFTGSAGAAGDAWLTRYDNVASPGDLFNASLPMCVSADVLISKFNNAKGGGLVALLNTGPGDKGLFLLLINNGNTDRLTLNTIDPNNGKIVQIASVPLGSAIVENAWYRLSVSVFVIGANDYLQVVAAVYSHSEPSSPNSGVAGRLGLMFFEGRPSVLGLEQAGFVGMAAWATSAVVNTSITNFFAQNDCPSG